MQKIAIITGVTGQDGSYLAEFLLKKGYVVHGIKRKSSSFNTNRIDHIFENPKYKSKFFLHYGDLTDTDSLTKFKSTLQSFLPKTLIFARFRILITLIKSISSLVKGFGAYITICIINFDIHSLRKIIKFILIRKLNQFFFNIL